MIKLTFVAASAILSVILVACAPVPEQPAAAPQATAQPIAKPAAEPLTPTAPPASAAPMSATSSMIQPQQVSIDTQGLSYSWQANLEPATPYDAAQPPGPTGMVQHIEINFGVTDPTRKQPGDPVMHIIPVDAYRQM